MRQNRKDSHKSGKFEVRPISFPSLMEVLTKDIITRWILPHLPARSGGRRSAAAPAEVAWDGAHLHVKFDDPQFGVAPGQAAVVYDGDRVLGGGWIE